MFLIEGWAWRGLRSGMLGIDRQHAGKQICTDRALPCYSYSDGTLSRKDKDRSVVGPEAGRRVCQGPTYRAGRAAPGSHDTRSGITAISEGSFQPS